MRISSVRSRCGTACPLANPFVTFDNDSCSDLIKGPACDRVLGSENLGCPAVLRPRRATEASLAGGRARDMCSHCSLPSLYILVKTYLPELLTSILSTHSLQNLGATWVLVDKRIHLVYIAIDYYVQSLLNGVVLGDLLGGERLGHGEFRGCATATEVRRRLKRREECRVGDRVESRRTICCVRKAEELVGSGYKSKGNTEGEEPGVVWGTVQGSSSGCGSVVDGEECGVEVCRG